jgi:hypothetical protein
MKVIQMTIVLILLNSAQGLTQACCSAGTPLSSQLALSFLQQGELLFNLAYDYNYLNDQFHHDEQLNDDDRLRFSQNILFRAQYGFTEKWALAVSLPYVFRSEQTGTDLTSYDNLSSSGIGDLLVQTNFTLLNQKQHHLLLSAGLKMPTGSNSETNELDLPLPADMQPGTGSWDGIFAALYEASNIWGGHFHFNTSATARFNGEGTRYDGKQEYQFGNEFTFVLGLNYEFLIKRSVLVPALNLSYRRTLIDITNGALTPSSGGDWLAIVPGVNYYITRDLSLMFSSSLPLYRYVEGIQLTTSYSFFIQIQYTLDTKRNAILLNY